jgi:hypothetical protein
MDRSEGSRHDLPQGVCTVHGDFVGYLEDHLRRLHRGRQSFSVGIAMKPVCQPRVLARAAR